MLCPELGRLQYTLCTMVSLEALFSIVATTGSIIFTVRDYEFFRDTVKALRPDKRLPCYKTVHDYTSNYLLSYCYPQYEIVQLPCDTIPVAYEIPTLTEVPRNRITVRIVQFYQWASFDVKTLPYLRDLNKFYQQKETNISQSPMYTQGEDILNLKRQIHVDDVTGYGRESPGDWLQFRKKNFPRRCMASIYPDFLEFQKKVTARTHQEMMVNFWSRSVLCCWWGLNSSH